MLRQRRTTALFSGVILILISMIFITNDENGFVDFNTFAAFLYFDGAQLPAATELSDVERNGALTRLHMKWTKHVNNEMRPDSDLAINRIRRKYSKQIRGEGSNNRIRKEQDMLMLQKLDDDDRGLHAELSVWRHEMPNTNAYFTSDDQQDSSSLQPPEATISAHGHNMQTLTAVIGTTPSQTQPRRVDQAAPIHALSHPDPAKISSLSFQNTLESTSSVPQPQGAPFHRAQRLPLTPATDNGGGGASGLPRHAVLAAADATASAWGNAPRGQERPSTAPHDPAAAAAAATAGQSDDPRAEGRSWVYGGGAAAVRPFEPSGDANGNPPPRSEQAWHGGGSSSAIADGFQHDGTTEARRWTSEPAERSNEQQGLAAEPADHFYDAEVEAGPSDADGSYRLSGEAERPDEARLPNGAEADRSHQPAAERPREDPAEYAYDADSERSYEPRRPAQRSGELSRAAERSYAAAEPSPERLGERDEPAAERSYEPAAQRSYEPAVERSYEPTTERDEPAEQRSYESEADDSYESRAERSYEGRRVRRSGRVGAADRAYQAREAASSAADGSYKERGGVLASSAPGRAAVEGPYEAGEAADGSHESRAAEGSYEGGEVAGGSYEGRAAEGTYSRASRSHDSLAGALGTPWAGRRADASYAPAVGAPDDSADGSRASADGSYDGGARAAAAARDGSDFDYPAVGEAPAERSEYYYPSADRPYLAAAEGSYTRRRGLRHRAEGSYARADRPAALEAAEVPYRSEGAAEGSYSDAAGAAQGPDADAGSSYSDPEAAEASDAAAAGRLRRWAAAGRPDEASAHGPRPPRPAAKSRSDSQAAAADQDAAAAAERSYDPVRAAAGGYGRPTTPAAASAYRFPAPSARGAAVAPPRRPLPAESSYYSVSPPARKSYADAAAAPPPAPLAPAPLPAAAAPVPAAALAYPLPAGYAYQPQPATSVAGPAYEASAALLNRPSAEPAYRPVGAYPPDAAASSYQPAAVPPRSWSPSPPAAASPYQPAPAAVSHFQAAPAAASPYQPVLAADPAPAAFAAAAPLAEADRRIPPALGWMLQPTAAAGGAGGNGAAAASPPSLKPQVAAAAAAAADAGAADAARGGGSGSSSSSSSAAAGLAAGGEPLAAKLGGNTGDFVQDGLFGILTNPDQADAVLARAASHKVKGWHPASTPSGDRSDDPFNDALYDIVHDCSLGPDPTCP